LDADERPPQADQDFEYGKYFSAGIGPPWRDSFVEFSGSRKPGLGQGENLRPN
jgi:hypothetical protein